MKEEKYRCLARMADMVFLILLAVNVFLNANIEWWVVLIPLVISTIYDIVELIMKMHNKAKKQDEKD